eukprot:349555_1
MTSKRKYYCEYCDKFLTSSSQKSRDQHNNGRIHKHNVQRYWFQFMKPNVINSVLTGTQGVDVDIGASNNNKHYETRKSHWNDKFRNDKLSNDNSYANNHNKNYNEPSYGNHQYQHNNYNHSRYGGSRTSNNGYASRQRYTPYK